MKLYLLGHSYKYAVEQVLLSVLDGEKPQFVDEKPERNENHAVVSLRCIGADALAAASLVYNGKRYRGAAKSSRVPDNAITRDRELQRLIKLAFFRAAREAASRELPWGATTGIRPSTLVTRMIKEGATPDAAQQRLRRDYYVAPERAQLAADCAAAEIAVRKTLETRDIALYIGIPFCPTRCAYCSFVSHSVEKSMKLIQPYLEALFAEAAALSEVVRNAGLRIVSVYIGGGTPTTLSAAQLDSLLTGLDDLFDLSSVREYTVEAGRPDTITEEKLAVMRAHNVNRVSVNPQTMSDSVLAAIGRLHSAEETLRAFELAKNAGFAAINMDLIAGLPGDTAEGFARSLNEVMSLRPENITVHTLSLKRGTRLTLEGTPIPSGGEVSNMLEHAHRELRSGGFLPYYLYRQKFTSGGFENTGWTVPGAESLYNIIMMDELRSVLSLGSGVTKLVVPEGHSPEGRIERIFCPKYPYEYIERSADIISNKAKIKSFFERI